MCSLLSGVPAPGRPPGQRHGSVDTKDLVPELHRCACCAGLQQQDQASRCHGLPLQAGSEYDDLHAHGADRYAPTDLRAFAARLDLITASECEDALRACANMDDLRACIAMMDLDDLCASASP